MIRGLNKKIIMVEGDFGLTLPIKIKGVTIENSEKIKIIIKEQKDGEALIEKEYPNVLNNEIDFQLTEAESNLLKPKMYFYTLDWYDNNDNFLCSIVRDGLFEVEDKY